MESLLRFCSKIFSKKSPTSLADQVIAAPKKIRKKRLRHSQSMPIKSFAYIEEAHARSKPVYKGKHPLKLSDVQLVVDSRGCPNALVQHPAFDPVVEKYTFSTPVENLSSPVEILYDNILEQFPAPPIDKSVPRRPKVAAPKLYDNLLPSNPAFERQPLTATVHLDIHGEPNVFRDGYPGQEGDNERIMMHSNISTKSLAANCRLRDGPVRRVVINPSARYESRPRMHSGASSRSVMDTSSRRYNMHIVEPRQRQASNASTTTRHDEYGYIGHNDSNYRRAPSSSSRSRPPQPPHRS